MSREEFLTELRKALQGRVSQQTVNDNLRYYEEYILAESHKGKTEAEVIAELGNPRLLAKSIIDAENATAEKSTAKSTAEPQSGMVGQDTASGEFSFKKIKIRIWLILAAVFLFVILLIILLAQVVAFLLPILLPIVIIFFLVAAISMNKRF